jgi:hypothetical protein
MASGFIQNWISELQDKIDFWYTNYPNTPSAFSVSPLNMPLVVDLNILNHNITSACPSPPFPQISFAHFPEPYYGDSDDSTKKLAVVLFYNPGPSGEDQLLSASGPGTFHDNYVASGSNYYNLSRNLKFCNGTINRFWNPKNNQLSNLFEELEFKKEDLKPLFLDMVPWHSDKFSGLNMARYNLPNCMIEVKKNVIVPAALNAENSAISRYANQLTNSSNKIVLFAVGAQYSNNFLNPLGFSDITNTIPVMIPHTVQNNNAIQINGGSSKMKVWKMIGDNLNLELTDEFTGLNNKEIYIINMWTANIGMDIPRDASHTLDHVLKNI